MIFFINYEVDDEFIIQKVLNPRFFQAEYMCDVFDRIKYEHSDVARRIIATASNDTT